MIDPPATGAATLECPTCGDVGAVAEADGCFCDGQPLICGCPGWVSVDSESEPFINAGDEPMIEPATGAEPLDICTRLEFALKMCPEHLESLLSTALTELVTLRAEHARLREALETIAESDDECQCDHDTEDCCAGGEGLADVEA